ncbi:hypothetical protein LSTR_LSTR008748 [Laodelphax striatellus]|uniref:Uncharacterized protein n=1 Tax=Laodelphax striatellus TaxID=195883 RepID=A0A482XQK9_LAOST|nr:hypothetical protein LSTR_LSTR008748 [Laodelphax striatellus]
MMEGMVESLECPPNLLTRLEMSRGKPRHRAVTSRQCGLVSLAALSSIAFSGSVTGLSNETTRPFAIFLMIVSSAGIIASVLVIIRQPQSREQLSFKTRQECHRHDTTRHGSKEAILKARQMQRRPPPPLLPFSVATIVHTHASKGLLYLLCNADDDDDDGCPVSVGQRAVPYCDEEEKEE